MKPGLGWALAVALCAVPALADDTLGSVRVGGGLDVRGTTWRGETRSGLLAPQLRVDAAGWFLPFLGVEVDLLSEVAGTVCCGVPSGVDASALRFTGGRVGLAGRYSWDNGFSLRGGLGWGGASVPVWDTNGAAALSTMGLTVRVEAAFTRDRFQASLGGVVLAPVAGTARITSIEPRAWVAVRLFDAGLSHWWLGLDGAALVETSTEDYAGVTARVGLGLRVALDAPATTAVAVSAPPLPLDATLELRVTQPDGSGAAQARVAIDGAVMRVTDEKGTATIPVAAGKHTVRVQRDGWRVATVPIELNDGERRALVVPLELPTGPGRVLGTVFDATTLKPVAGARISAADKEVRSDADGNFIVADAGPGPVRVYVAAPGYRLAEEVVQVPPEGDARLTVSSEPVSRNTPAVIRGVVVSRDGQAISATVEVSGRSEQVLINDEGRFTLTLPPGGWSLKVSAPGHVTQTRRFELTPGEQAVFHCVLLPK